MFTSFSIDGIFVYTGFPLTKVHEGAKKYTICHPPHRKPKVPVPKWGI